MVGGADWLVREDEVRQVLEERLNTRFERRRLPVGLRTDGSVREHEFDLVSSDGKIVGEIKTFEPLPSGSAHARYRPSAKIGATFQACYLLEKVKAERKILVLTDSEFYEIFRDESDGIISRDIQILLIPVQMRA